MSEIKKLLKEKNKAISQGQYKEAASICNAVGSELYEKEKYEEALEQHLEELEFCETTGDQLGIAVANRRIGECYAMLDNFKKALLHVRKFYDLSVSLKSVIEEQRAWATFGRTYYLKYLHESSSASSDDNTNSKTLNQAELAYYKALKLLYTLGSEIKPVELAEMKCRLLLNIGLVCETRGDHKGSAKYAKQGLEIATEYNLYEDIHRCAYALGTLHQKNEKHLEATEILDLALSATKKMHNKNLTCEVLFSKGLSLISLERYDEAKRCLKSAYKLHHTNDEDYEKIIKTLKVCIGLYSTQEKLKETKDLKEKKLLLEKIADGLSSVSCYKLAVKKYILTLDTMEEMQSSLSEKAPIYYSLAQTYLDDGNILKSLEYFQKEYNCHEGKPQEQLVTLWKILDLHEKEGRVDKAEELYLKAVSLSEKTGNKKIIHSSLSKLLSFYNGLNKLCDAKDVKEKLDNIKYECLSEDEFENEEESQDLFGDICLSELSDSDNNEEIITSRKRTKRVEAKVNEKGETPLHQACINGNLNVVKRLVESGHSVNVRDYCGWTPLHEACNYGYYDIVEYLLEKGANINDPGGPACGGITALHDAASCGNFDVIHLLLKRGASVTVVDKNGETPLEALLLWKKRSLNELDDVTIKQCKSTEEELRSKMKEAGLSIDNSKFSDISYLSDSLPDINRRSGEKRYRSPSLCSDVDSSDDSDCMPPYLHISNEKDWDVADDAKAEYKSVMESLRRKTSVMSPTKKQSQSPKIVEDSPLLNENEIVNEWLIKDTNQIPKQSKKKRKRAKLNVRTSKCIDNFLIQKDPPEQSVNHKDVALIEEDSSCSISSTNSGDKNVGENVSQLSKIENSKLSFCLRVHIANKVILVPVPDDACTISWLSEEAAKRFQSLDGSKPHLTMTKDGALLSCSDLVKNIFSNNEEVFTSVEMWDDPSLEDKYIQLCNKRNIVVLPSIQKRLQNSELSFELNFSNCNIPPMHLNVIFCTLTNYKSLQHLNISGTCFNDAGINELLSCFPCFSNLISLNLSCCSLTSQNLNSITDYINSQTLKSSVLPSLKLLDLSFNNFSQCICFSALLTLNSLVSLNVSSCGLPPSVFANGTMRDALSQKPNLEEFDISGNNLDSNVISNILNNLPRKNLKKLNLSHTLETESEIGTQLLNFFSGMLPCLSDLSLQGCYLTDDDINQITEGLLYCPQLQICDLSANPSLSSHSLCNFINRAYENSLSMTDLNITGTCTWTNHDFNNLSNFFKLKTLKHLCFDNCPEDITEKLNQIWTSRWGSRAVCSNLGFCELTLK